MKWSGRRDLNSGPPAPKAGALPGCATPRQLLAIDSTALLNFLSIDLAPTVHNHESSKSLKIRSVFDTGIVGSGTLQEKQARPFA
jgi:hypothetical protein